ncbi:MAG: hypothetical protein ACIAQF_11040 [Phycisphaerales bacterium JB065]
MGLKEQIVNTAGSPRSYTSDGTTVVGQNLKDLIEADRYLASKERTKKGRNPLRLSRIKAGGPV